MIVFVKQPTRLPAPRSHGNGGQVAAKHNELRNRQTVHVNLS